MLSLNVLVGYAGQVSLGHAAFFGIGAYTGAILATRYAIPFVWTLPSAMLVAGAAGLILGLPSLRVKHDFLVLVTIGLNFIVVSLFKYIDFFGGALGIVGIPLPSLAGYELRGGVYLGFCVILTALSAWACYALQKTWAGLGMYTVRDDEQAAASVGVNSARYKIAAFAIAGAFAGLGGALYAPFVGNVFPDRFGFLASVTLLAMLVFGGIGTVRGALFGGAVFKMLPEYLRFASEYRFAIYGATLLIMIVLQPRGVLGEGSLVWRWIRSGWRKLFGGGKSERDRVPLDDNDDAEPADNGAGERDDPTRLSVRDVHVEFGGLKALDGVSMNVRTGEIVGLIGPNGAGKTTLINAIAGVVSLEKGTITLGESELQGRSPDRIARRGVARTFQVTRPFSSLDVQHNILSGNGIHQYARITAFVRGYSESLPRASRLGHNAGLQNYLSSPAGQIPIGLLRRMEVARALATQGQFVLLDEPAAGLTHGEVQELRELVVNIPSENRGVILIEHNMRFAMDVCDRLVVLASGEVLARGTPQEVRENPQVIDVYLGGEA